MSFSFTRDIFAKLAARSSRVCNRSILSLSTEEKFFVKVSYFYFLRKCLSHYQGHLCEISDRVPFNKTRGSLKRNIERDITIT